MNRTFYLTFLSVIYITFTCMMSGCAIGNTMFHMDSDSNSPTFGINLIPNKSWFKRDISYHPRQKSFPSREKSNSRPPEKLEVVDLIPAPHKKPKGFEAEVINNRKEDVLPAELPEITEKKPINVTLPEVNNEVTTYIDVDSIPLFD